MVKTKYNFSRNSLQASVPQKAKGTSVLVVHVTKDEVGMERQSLGWREKLEGKGSSHLL